MINAIVEMVLKELWRRDTGNTYGTLEALLEEINDKATTIIIDGEKEERGAKDDR